MAASLATLRDMRDAMPRGPLGRLRSPVPFDSPRRLPAALEFFSSRPRSAPRRWWPLESADSRGHSQTSQTVDTSIRAPSVHRPAVVHALLAPKGPTPRPPPAVHPLVGYRFHALSPWPPSPSLHCPPHHYKFITPRLFAQARPRLSPLLQCSCSPERVSACTRSLPSIPLFTPLCGVLAELPILLLALLGSLSPPLPPLHNAPPNATAGFLAPRRLAVRCRSHLPPTPAA